MNSKNQPPTATAAASVPSPAQAWLELPGGGRYEVHSACSLGRSSSNQIPLKDERISRCHALINARTDTEFWLSDLGSSNGTFLNGNRITQAERIYDQDQIRIGHQVVIFHQPLAGLRVRNTLEPSIATMTMCDNKSTPCWLLIAVFETASHQGKDVSVTDMPKLTQRWFDDTKAIIEEHGGCVNKYLGNGFLAYWLDRAQTVAAVAAAIRRLLTIQEKSALRFRLALHHGRVSIGESARLGEGTLSGAEVSLIYRLDKLAGIFNVKNLASDSAHAKISAHLPLEEIGRTTAHGFDQDRLFYKF